MNLARYHLAHFEQGELRSRSELFTPSATRGGTLSLPDSRHRDRFYHGTGAFAPVHENRTTRLNLLTQIGDAEKDRRTQASLATDLPRIAILRITPHRPDTKGRVRGVTEDHESDALVGQGCSLSTPDWAHRGQKSATLESGIRTVSCLNLHSG